MKPSNVVLGKVGITPYTHFFDLVFEFLNLFFYSYISILRVEKALALRSAPIALNYERRALLPFLFIYVLQTIDL